MDKKYSHDELVERMKSPGWAVVTDKDDNGQPGSLEDALKTSHARRTKGEKPGIIRQIETTIELDMIDIEMLWRYLGLPV